MKKEKLFIVTVFSLIVLFGGAYQVNAQEVKSQKIPSIEKPNWIFNAGMSKGKFHDRQDLGFILRENTVLKVRQANPNYKEKLTVRLLGNDSKEEQRVDVGSDWLSISGKSALTPFVDTPYGEDGAVLEYEIESDRAQKPLPIYSYNDNEKDFFNLWDKYDCNYVLIKGKDFQLFVPNRDKDLLKNSKDFKSLNEIIDHYTDIFKLYNQISGFDGSTPENENGKNRYFLKADLHGPGGAYYSERWAANSALTADMWLNKVSWGALHEIAHGYQAGFDGRGMYTGEVSNNLFGVQYQYSKYGKEADKIGWLFDFGGKERIEKGLYQELITNKGSYDSADLRQKLILLTMLKQKAGDEAHTEMYQGYRKLANQPGFNPRDYLLPDLLNHYYSEHSKLDFTPVLSRWGLELDNKQIESNQLSGYLPVASLADVIPKEKLPEARNYVDDHSKILITSNFEMVTNDEIASLGLTGDVTVKLKTEDINQLIDADILLKNGNQVVQTKKITGDTVTFNQVPNGIYTIGFDGKQMQKLAVTTPYVYVKEAKNNIEITVDPLKVSRIVNQTINFLGVNDDKFGEFHTNLNKNEATFSITKKDPHSSFKGETYATVNVFDKNGKSKYVKFVQGTDAVTGTDTIPIVEGDMVSIYHAEPKHRLTCKDPVQIIDPNRKTNSFIVTNKGLRNIDITDNVEADLIKKIDLFGMALLKNPNINNIPYNQCVQKRELYFAIQLLDEPEKTNYMHKYQSLFQ